MNIKTHRRSVYTLVCTLLLGLSTVSATALAAPDALVLSENGKARCAIVVDAAVMSETGPDLKKIINPEREEEVQRQRLRESVKDLAHYLEVLSGAAIPVITNGDPVVTGHVPIRIGQQAAAVFGPTGITAEFRQGLRIVADPKRGIGLYGESGLADSYAIYGLLDQLGCRWFFPGKLGEVIPAPVASLAFPVQDIKDAPYTIFRDTLGYSSDEAVRRRNRMGGNHPPTQHCLEGYVSKEEKAAHPEWIAETRDGKPMPGRLKWSNRELANRIGEIICEQQKQKPKFFYCLSPDDGARFDESELDAALDAGDFDAAMQTISLTDRAVTFYNRIVERVVQEYPDVMFSALAYVQYTRPPIREKPHKNLIIQIAPITYGRAHPMNLENVPDNDALRHIVEGWGRVSQATSYYFYGYFLAEPLAPFPCLRRWANDVPYIYEKGSCRYWQPETSGNNEFFAIAQWMGMRMAWNPKQDPWALYREANSHLYGEAAAEMWTFWDTLDRFWVETPEYAGASFGYLHRFTPERMAELQTLLSQATDAAKTDDVKQRVALVQTSLDLTKSFLDLRRDLAEGRWSGLTERSIAWNEKASTAAKEHYENRCFASCWWRADKSFATLYFGDFYANTHNSADQLATSKRALLKQPVRTFRIATDKELKGLANGFATPGFDDSNWQETDVSYRTWSSEGYHNYMGAMWYRATLDAPERPEGQRIWLWIGATDGTAQVFVNGKAVQGRRELGKPDETPELIDAPGGFCAPLIFDVTDAIRSGSNTLAILATRTAVNELGTGGLLAPVTLFCEP